MYVLLEVVSKCELERNFPQPQSLNNNCQNSRQTVRQNCRESGLSGDRSFAYLSVCGSYRLMSLVGQNNVKTKMPNDKCMILYGFSKFC